MTQHQADKVLPRMLHWSSVLMFAVVGTYAAGFLRIAVKLFSGITFDGRAGLSDVALLIVGFALVIVLSAITSCFIYTMVMLQ